jgi:protocatechuate 3,4-dioxygenase beta subunit
MSAHSAKIAANVDLLRIATPCPISWEEMTGNRQVRFCDHCRLNVYNISELSRREAEALIVSTEGRLCARLYRRQDGTILTKDCPVGLRTLRMRVSKRAAAVFTAIAGISSVVFGQQSSARDGKTACTPQTRITRTNASAGHAATILSGNVVDANGAAVAGAIITLTNDATKETQKTTANDAGRFQFASLAPADYSITIEAPAFKTHQITNVIVEPGKLVNLETILEITDQALTGVVDVTYLVDTPPPGTTIITAEMIRKLPIQK